MLPNWQTLKSLPFLFGNVKKLSYIHKKIYHEISITTIQNFIAQSNYYCFSVLYSCYLHAFNSTFINFSLSPPPVDPTVVYSVEEKPPFLYEIFMACILAPLWEELAFRHAPGLIAKGMGKQFLLPIIIISSALFGWGHHHGAESILRQGVMGLLFFWVYIKNGYSYWSSTIVHAAWNTTLFFVYPY